MHARAQTLSYVLLLAFLEMALSWYQIEMEAEAVSYAWFGLVFSVLGFAGASRLLFARNARLLAAIQILTFLGAGLSLLWFVTEVGIYGVLLTIEASLMAWLVSHGPGVRSPEPVVVPWGAA